MVSRGVRFSFIAIAVTLLVYARSAAIAAPPDVLTVAPSGAEYTSIQDAIDDALPGDRVEVYPGAYVESATGRLVLGATGPYQFGLFLGADKAGVTIQGVDAKGHAIHDWKKVAATVATDATNIFGPSGIFVEADGVTIAGLGIGANLSGQNKTIEVIGDDFSLLDCDVSDVGGSVYVNDYRFDDGADTSHVQRYRLDGNRFADGVSIDLADGAGYSGAAKHRSIRHNRFTNSGWWPVISFNGSDTGVPWFVHSVGGAVIKENSFVSTYGTADPYYLARSGHIRARGTYDESQFDWKSWWNDNEYNHAYVVGPKPPEQLRESAYTSGPYLFDHVRRIGTIREAEEANALPGDRIRSK